MNQVNQQLVNQLSLKDKLGREKQLSEQLGPLRQQLETVRKTGPVNGIGEEHLTALIGQHQELIGELRASIDEELKPEQINNNSEISNIAESYLARNGKPVTAREAVSSVHVESLSHQELSQIRLMQEAISKPSFSANKQSYDSWHSGSKGLSYLDETKNQMNGLFNLMSIRGA